jgi:hypothetical protein
LKNLPLGISTLSLLLESNGIYVDKTEYAFNLIKTPGRFFLSRPRRFGKSLFVDTLKEIFEGNQKLFEGLFIHDKWDWTKKYPVIKVDFAEGMLNSRKDLDEKIHEILFLNEKNQPKLTLDKKVYIEIPFLLQALINFFECLGYKIKIENENQSKSMGVIKISW